MKAKRQPKAGDNALKPSKPFAINPRGVPMDQFRPIHRAAPDSEREPTVYPAQFKIKRYAVGAHVTRDAAPVITTWANKGGMMGGATGACKGITSAPDVARAFIGTRG